VAIAERMCLGRTGMKNWVVSSVWAESEEKLVALMLDVITLEECLIHGRILRCRIVVNVRNDHSYRICRGLENG